MNRETIEAMVDVARSVKAGVPKSYVQAAHVLSDFVIDAFSADDALAARVLLVVAAARVVAGVAERDAGSMQVVYTPAMHAAMVELKRTVGNLSDD